MNTSDMLVDTVTRILSDHCNKAIHDSAEAGTFPEALFELLQSNGLLEIAATDSGVELSAVFAVLETAGRFALPIPLAEIVFAHRWLPRSESLVSIGLATPDGATQVPWGRRVDEVISLSPAGGLQIMRPVTVEPGVSLAGEARDSVSAVERRVLPCVEPAFALLALSRVALMAGALRQVLDLSLSYAGEREQFGRPISGFQAIQHYLALMAAEVAAAGRAARAAAMAADGDLADERLLLEVAAAKARVGEAVGFVVETAHQIHGAMGYTHEHRLHHFTRRLWCWREEYGNERYWQTLLGERVAALGADNLWGFLASRG
jgi:hypothetical protein